MAMRDPKERRKQQRRTCSPGDKVLVPVGHRRYQADSGTPMLVLRHVCVHDLSGKDDVGATVDAQFPAEGAGAGFLDDWALAMGRGDPYDPMSDDDVEAIMAAGAVGGRVESRRFRGKDKVEVRKWWHLRPEQRNASEWAEVIAAAERGWRDHLEWRAKQDWGASGNGGGARDEWGGGEQAEWGGGGAGQSEPGWGEQTPEEPSQEPATPAPDDEIPF